MISKRFCLFAILLAAMNLLVFARVARFDFLNYDDEAYVSKNPHIQNGLTADGVLWAFSAGLLAPSENTDYWQPVTFLSRMLDFQIGGADPAFHHLMNLAYHVLNTLLLFHFMWRLTGRMERSFWLAALFAIHPQHVESVAWVTERKDVLFGLFWLLGMETYLNYVKASKTGEKWKFYLLTLAMFACSLMSKPMAVTFPCVLLMLDVWPLSRFGCQNATMKNSKLEIKNSTAQPWEFLSKRTWRLVLEKIPFLTLSVMMGLLTIRSQSAYLRPYPFFIIVSNALVSYATYLYKTVWPAHLALHYPHPGFSLTFVQTAMAAILLSFISICAIILRKEKPHLLFGWCWFLGTLAPVITLNDIAGADRFTYLALIGIFMMAVWEAAEWAEGCAWFDVRGSMNDPSSLRLWGPIARPKWLRMMGGISLAAFMEVSWFQTGYWRNSETVVIHSSMVAHNDWITHNQLGILYLNRGEIDRGEAELREAVKIRPTFGYAHFNLGVALMQKKKYQEAIESFKKTLKFNPRFFDAEFNIGDADIQLGQILEACRHYFRSIQLNPAFPPAHRNLALGLASLGFPKLAEKQLATAWELQPGNFEAQKKILEDLDWVHSLHR